MLLDQLAELQPGVVVLTGGDPLKRPDLLTIVRDAVRRGLTVALAPSVTPLLTADAIARLVDAGIRRVALSLDGPTPGVHDRFRGVEGSFDATRRAIDAVRTAGLGLQLNTSLDRRTVRALGRTADVVAAIAPDLWSVFFVVPVGRAAADRSLGPHAAEALFHFLYDWQQATNVPLKTTAAPAYRRVCHQRDAARRHHGEAVPPRRAPAVTDGRGFVFVSHTGDVQPSGFLPLVAGNVRSASLPALYRESALFRNLRSPLRLEGRCGDCPFRNLCGGSRARAYAVTGNPFAEDPGCAYRPRGDA